MKTFLILLLSVAVPCLARAPKLAPQIVQKSIRYSFVRGNPGTLHLEYTPDPNNAVQWWTIDIATQARTALTEKLKAVGDATLDVQANQPGQLFYVTESKP